MTERLNYGGGRHYDHYDDDDTGHDADYQEGREQEYTASFAEADLAFVHEDYTAAPEDFSDQREQLEHQLDFAEDDGGETDFEALFKERSKSYRQRRGRFVPPKRRWHRTPVFVRVKDLQG